MKSTATALILVIASISVIMAMPALADDTKALETQAKLEVLIDRHIASCGAKIGMLESRSDVIRRSAIRTCRISTFCLTSKDLLLEEMTENNVEPKAYKVSLYLNEKFRAVVLAQD